MVPDNEMDPEIRAISEVYAALKVLEGPAQRRVVEYVGKKLAIDLGTSTFYSAEQDPSEPAVPVRQPEIIEDDSEGDELEGISPVARKWMARNDLAAEQLSRLFSLGVDEIDLVAKSVPGKTKKEKMRNVILLKGVAAYLSGGVARVTHDQVKEAAVHYDAYDSSNFASYLKTMSSEVTGSKEGGYSLPARGLASATELIKEMTAGKT